MTTSKWPTSPLVPHAAPDLATQELLAPAPDTPPAAVMPSAPPITYAVTADYAHPDAFLKAMQDGTIPSFAPEPDANPPPLPPPVDVPAEQAAYAKLLAFINAHKDAGTRITCLAPDLFTNGLT